MPRRLPGIPRAYVHLVTVGSISRTLTGRRLTIWVPNGRYSSPVALLVGDESAKVAIRADVARRHRDGEEPVGSDAALDLREALSDEVNDLVVVVRRRWAGTSPGPQWGLFEANSEDLRWPPVDTFSWPRTGSGAITDPRLPKYSGPLWGVKYKNDTR